MKIYLLFFIGFFGVLWCAHGQTTLSGTVVANDDGTPIPSASIIPNGETQNGVATDFDGNFKLVVDRPSGTITITSLGFTPVTLGYSGNQNFQVTLDEQSTGLDEVVLIGYGTSKKGDITSAISKVEDIGSISSRPVSTFTDFLQGSVAGVTVLQQGGDPNANGKIIIRGYGSFSNENPLTVVDGMPYYGPPINPQDIASVSILKDAASAAIYGAQAASGVIVIETKKGKKGKPQITIDLNSGMEDATNLPTPLNAKQQADTYNLAADNGGSPRQAAHNPALNPWGQTTRTNWIDAVFRTAVASNVNINVSGATDDVNYMTSFGYNKKEGVLIGTQSERYSFRMKSDQKLWERVTIGENVYYSRTEAVGTNTETDFEGTIMNAVRMDSAAPIYDENGDFHGSVPYDLSEFAGAYGDLYNPVALLLRPNINNPRSYVNATAYLDYNILDGLKFRTSYNYSILNTYDKNFNPRIPELGRTSLTNTLSQGYSTTNRWVWDNQLSYNKTFGKHHLDLTAIYSSQYTHYEAMNMQVQGFSSEGVFNQYMRNGSIIRNPGSNVYEDALTSAIGRVMYDFDNRYFATASIRRDATSRLDPSNQVGYFPSATVGWRLSGEDFFNINAINDLKFRASWGQIGNINSVGYYSFDVPLSTNDNIIGEDGMKNDKGVTAGRQSNPDLNWETSESIDVGLDASLLENRLSLTLDYFQKTTKGMILGGLPDQHQGVSASEVNGGEVRNKGFEISVAYSDHIGDLGFSVRANFSKLDNELVNLDGYNNSGIDFIGHGDAIRTTLRPFRSKVGEALYSNYLIPYLGIFQTQAEVDSHSKDGNPIQPNALPGDFKYADSNNDGKIDNNDRVYMGSYLPDLTYSLNLTFDYKGFDLGLIVQGVAGVEAFNGYKYSTYNASLSGYNLDNRVLNAWTPTNTNTDVPRISTKDNNHNFDSNSSWYMEDASYVRLKNLTLGYALPSRVMDKVGVGSLRCYISAENLFTITDYSGMDPEVGGNGLDTGRYPLYRTISLGLNVRL